MKILILTYTNPFNASGILAYDLLIGFSSVEGNDVRILVREWDKYEDNRIVTIETAFEHCLYAIIRRIKRFRKKTLKFIFKNYKTKDEKLKDKINSDYYFEYDMPKTFFSTKKILKRAGFKPDAIIVLFMSHFISFKNQYELFKLTGAKIYLYLMDMAPMTGGCHYAWDCVGYTKECGSCPALYSNNQNDQTRVNYLFKKMYIEKTNIVPIAASEWQWQQLRKSSLFVEKKKVKILSPTNQQLFFPRDKRNAREKLGIPHGGKILLLGSVNLIEKRKGYKEIIEILNILYNEFTTDIRDNILVVIAGKNTEVAKLIPFKTLSIGFLSHEELALAYQAADIFLNASIEDSGPTMINQSIMSGTPVVAFEMGVAPDLIVNGVTGYMAKLYDKQDYAFCINKVLSLSDFDYNEMSNNCRRLAISKCSHKKVFEDLWELINNVK